MRKKPETVDLTLAVLAFMILAPMMYMVLRALLRLLEIAKLP